MNIDTALRRREALEEMTWVETALLARELLDEVARLRTALTVPTSKEPFTSPLMPDDTRYGYVPHAFVLDVPSVQLVVSRGELKQLALWFMSVGCDIGVYLLEEIGEEP